VFYRCLAPLTSLVWLILVWCIFQWKDIIPSVLTRYPMIALLSLFTVYAGIKTYQNVLYYRVLPSYIEWRAYKTLAKEIHIQKSGAILIFVPPHFSSERYDEFGVLSSHYLFDIYHLIYCAMNEKGGLHSVVIPRLYVSLPEVNPLFELKEVYYKKSPNGKFVYRNINGDDQLSEVPLGSTLDKMVHSGMLDSGTIVVPSIQDKLSKKQFLYVLNLNYFYRK